MANTTSKNINAKDKQDLLVSTSPADLYKTVIRNSGSKDPNTITLKDLQKNRLLRRYSFDDNGGGYMGL